MLLFLTLDALYASWWDGPLYARIQLNLFYNSHALSILPLTMAGFYMWLRKHDALSTAAFAALGTASIHELALDANDLLYYHVGSGISTPYAIVLFGLLGVGLLVSKAYHRKVWFWMALMMMAWFLVVGYIDTNTPFVIGSTIDPNVPFGASQYFWNPVTNFAEVISWIAPCLLWFLPRRWFNRASR